MSNTPSPAVGLRAEVEKIRADYQSRMKFCDIDPLPYYRDFVERLTRALSTPTSGEASAPPPLSEGE